jgi:hypothetical protein
MAKNGKQQPKGRKPTRSKQSDVNSNGHAGGAAPYQAYQADASHRNGVLNLSTVGTNANAIKRIEGIDGPGEGHFFEALAKSLGPYAAVATGRAQVVQLLNQIEPEAIKNGFVVDNNPANMQSMQMMNLLKNQYLCMQTMMTGGLGALGANSASGLVPLLGTNPIFAPGGGATSNTDVVQPPGAPNAPPGTMQGILTNGNGALGAHLIHGILPFNGKNPISNQGGGGMVSAGVVQPPGALAAPPHSHGQIVG